MAFSNAIGQNAAKYQPLSANLSDGSEDKRNHADMAMVNVRSKGQSQELARERQSEQQFPICKPLPRRPVPQQVAVQQQHGTAAAAEHGTAATYMTREESLHPDPADAPVYVPYGLDPRQSLPKKSHPSTSEHNGKEHDAVAGVLLALRTKWNTVSTQ